MLRSSWVLRISNLARLSPVRCSFATAPARKPQHARAAVTPLSREHRKQGALAEEARCPDVGLFPRNRHRCLVAGRSHPPHEPNDRRQRHIYDGTRRYYLLGRDRLIADLAPAPGASVLEIGCGTGRNLVLAARTLSRYAVFRHRRFDGDADISHISHFAPRPSEANSRRPWRRNRLQSAALVRGAGVRQGDDFLQPVDDPGLASSATGSGGPPQARRILCTSSISAIRWVCRE